MNHTQDTKERFIQLRAEGWTFDRLAAELNVAKRTLITWSRQFQFDIQNLRTIHREKIQEKYLISEETRLEAIANQLAQVQAELATRSFTDLSTNHLLDHARKLRMEMATVAAEPVLTEQFANIPDEERVYGSENWKA